MRLSAIDIKKQEFKKSMRGYDVSEVEAYLDTVGNTFENLFRELELTKEQVMKLQEEKEELVTEINVYRENEKTFQKAIVKSQDMAEDILDNAKKRAELIIKEAEILSSKTKVQAHEEFLNLKQELEELKNKNEAVIDDIKNYLVEKLNSIEEYQRNRKIFKLENNIASMEQVSVHEPVKEEQPSNTFGLNLGSLNMGLDDQSSK
ncbi:MAG TPA: DivIVA domain-containing protein [Ignavibacteria bacterium]|nr:DivIVA domain-containing protein [Ignavibacteria bacterium]